MKERIDLLVETLGISARQFSLSIGKSESFARTIKNTVGADVIGEILRAYPQVNLYWLITGEGEVFRNHNEPIIGDTIPNNARRIILPPKGYIKIISADGKEEQLKVSSDRNISQQLENFNNQIKTLQELVKSQKETISAKEDLINLLKRG